MKRIVKFLVNFFSEPVVISLQGVSLVGVVPLMCLENAPLWCWVVAIPGLFTTLEIFIIGGILMGEGLKRAIKNSWINSR